MPNPIIPDSEASSDTGESFDAIFSQYERSHLRQPAGGNKQIEATVVAVSAESVFLDIGFKTEGILPLAEFAGAAQPVKPGDKLLVSVKGRDPEGYYELSRLQVAQPKDWSSLERAFADKTAIVGTVTGVVKGGLSVDVGVRAFMPASRSGARDAKDMQDLIGQNIRCLIIKLDAADEDIVVDRRALAEEEARGVKERRYSEIKEGDTVRGEVRSLTDYGAFIDLGGVDALLHVGEIAWGRVNQPSDVLSVGQEIEVKVLKVTLEGVGTNKDRRRIAVGMKQLQPHPWDAVVGKYKAGERARGIVTRVVDFGAFVELEPGIEGLIHVSEMSWAKKVRKASDLVKQGDVVEAVILGVNAGERRLSLGLKQTLGDPWAEVAQKFPAGSIVEGPVSSLTKFGAFVQISEGVEGMVHISDMSAEKRLNHPQEMLRMGQVVKAQVLAIDKDKRQLKLGMKQMIPSGLDEYIAEHKPGDTVTGRIVEINGSDARVELGEGIHASCRVVPLAAAKKDVGRVGATDVGSLSSMLQSRWKSGAAASDPKPEAIQAGQVRSFRIVSVDSALKRIEVSLVP